MGRAAEYVRDRLLGSCPASAQLVHDRLFAVHQSVHVGLYNGPWDLAHV
jgi:hypothetical protein